MMNKSFIIFFLVLWTSFSEGQFIQQQQQQPGGGRITTHQAFGYAVSRLNNCERAIWG